MVRPTLWTVRALEEAMMGRNGQGRMRALVAVLAAGFRAEAEVRAEALRAAGAAGRTLVVSATERVPELLPGVAGLRIHARASVRAP